MAHAATAVARIGKYTLLDPLGRGGMAVVYRARDDATGELVAIKTALQVKSSLSSLRREVEALRRLHHPGIVRILESGVDAGRPWYAMEILEGPTLAAIMGSDRDADQHSAAETTVHATVISDEKLATPWARTAGATVAAPREASGPPAASSPPVNMTQLLAIARRLCSVLTFVHGEGLVHGDLKPGNVFLRTDGTPVLTDFGLAGRWSGTTGREVLEHVPLLAGTASYMAPEQVSGEPIDARTDLYALGCMIYEIVARRPPFVADDMRELLERQLHAAPQPPSDLVHGLPRPLDELIMRLLSKRRADRPGHASDVDAALADLGVAGWPGGEPAVARPYLYRPELSGREDLLGRLEQHLDRASEGRGVCVLIGGESGIGKSSVAARLARAGLLRGFTVIAGAAQTLLAADAEGRREAPLHPFGSLLQTVADLCTAGGPKVFDQLLGPRAKILAACEPSLGGLPEAASLPAPPPLPAEAHRRRLLDALAETLSALAARKPVLLVIDDLHWADELSFAFLSSLPDDFFAQRPLLAVATFRTENASSIPVELLGRSDVVRETVGQLTTEALRPLVEDMLGARPAPAALIATLTQSSGGHPYFIVEYLRAAMAAGRLRREPHGRWQLDVGHNANDHGNGSGESSVPESLDALLERRLDAVSGPQRQLIDLAAILGREIETSLLAAAAARIAGALGDDLGLLAATAELLRAQIFEEPAPGVLRFVHDKLRERAYALIPAPARRDLHAAAAAAIEARDHGEPAASRAYARLAHHFGEAGDIDKALAYLDKAAAEAARNFSNREAATLLEAALALGAISGQAVLSLRRGRWERELGRAYLGLGRLRESHAHLAAAAAALDKPVPQTPRRVLLGLFGQVGLQVLHRSGLARKPSSETGRERLLEAARSYELMGLTSFFTANQLRLVLYALVGQLNLAERSGSADQIAVASAGVQAAAGFVPARRLAQVYGRIAERALGGVTDKAVESWVCFLISCYHVGACAWDAAAAWSERGGRIARALGFPRRFEECWGVRALLPILRGDFHDAEVAYEEMLDSANRGDVQTKNWGYMGLAQAHLYGGRFSRAVEEAKAGERLVAKLGRPEQISTYGTLALCQARVGAYGAAEAAARKAIAQMESGEPLVAYNVAVYTETAEAFFTLWQQETSAGGRASYEQLLRRTLRQIRRLARVFPAARPGRDLWRGLYEWRRTHQRRTRWLLTRSRELARRLGMPYAEARAELALLATVDRATADAGSRRARALDLLTACGAAAPEG